MKAGKRVNVMVYTDADLKDAAKSAGANFTELFNDALRAFLQIGDEKAELLKELTKLNTKRASILRALEKMETKEDIEKKTQLGMALRIVPYQEHYRKNASLGKWTNKDNWLKESARVLEIPVPELMKLLEGE